MDRKILDFTLTFPLTVRSKRHEKMASRTVTVKDYMNAIFCSTNKL